MSRTNQPTGWCEPNANQRTQPNFSHFCKEARPIKTNKAGFDDSCVVDMAAQA